MYIAYDQGGFTDKDNLQPGRDLFRGKGKQLHNHNEIICGKHYNEHIRFGILCEIFFCVCEEVFSRYC